MTKSPASATTSLNSIDKVKERVQKLLNQAADQEGTPEAEVFYAKAFDIMATYGFNERDLDSPDEGDDVIHKVFQFRGAYTDMQAMLLSYLVAALHCVAFTNGVYQSTRVESSTVFGARRHIERVEMLFGLLNPMMAAGARGVSGMPQYGVSTVVARRSYMTGFAAKVYERLAEAEASTAGSSSRYELALIDDVTKATAARDAYAEELDLHLSKGRRPQRTFHPDSFDRGVDAAGSADLGQAKVKARPALPC